MPSSIADDQNKQKRIRSFNPYVRKAFNIVGNILFILLLIFMVVMVFFTVQSRIQGTSPSVFGHQLYTVVSGSMSPAFEAGSVVAVKSVDPEALEEGDIITFSGLEEDAALTTHRIVGVNEGDELSFTTKGDANRVEDPEPVLAENVVGEVTLAIPYAGHIAEFIQTGEGLLSMLIIPGVFIIGIELRNLFKYATEMEEKKVKENEDEILPQYEEEKE